MLPGGESQTVLQEALAEETELSRERPRVPELSGQAQGEGQRERKPWGPAGPPPPLRQLAENGAYVSAIKSKGSMDGFSTPILKRKKC